MSRMHTSQERPSFHLWGNLGDLWGWCPGTICETVPKNIQRRIWFNWQDAYDLAYRINPAQFSGLFIEASNDTWTVTSPYARYAKIHSFHLQYAMIRPHVWHASMHELHFISIPSMHIYMNCAVITVQLEVNINCMLHHLERNDKYYRSQCEFQFSAAK